MSTKYFFIDHHGCAKNQVDAEIIIGIMKKNGWENTPFPEKADLIIVNSCGFINPAKEESLNAVINAKNAYPKTKILLAGCLAERYADILKTELVEADAIFGNGDLSKLPEIIKKLYEESEKPVLTPPQIGICGGKRPKILNFPRSVYIKITEGCDNFCSFCAIPIIRGRLRSRSIEDIIKEIKEFIQKGFYEFNLIGQDLAAFQINNPNANQRDIELSAQIKMEQAKSLNTKEETGLAKLLKSISEIKGKFKIRLLYIHPDHFSEDILPIMTHDTRFLPYFDIPFQSGSEKIIKSMNRKGYPELYLNLIENIRSAFKEAESPYGEPAIRTTFMTGFPGETDEDFAQTEIFLQKLKPLWSGGFIYSKEEDTAAYSFKNKVSKKTAEKRLSILQKTQTEITCNALDKFCGHVLDVLIEEIIISHEENNTDGNGSVNKMHLALGRAWFQAPEIDGAVIVSFSEEKTDSCGKTIKPGSIVRVKITSRNGFDLNAFVQ